MMDTETTAPDADDLDAQLAAMREAETSGPEQPEDAPVEEQAPEAPEARQEAETEEKPPLSYEELQTRHENLQRALKEERGKRREYAEDREWRARVEAQLRDMQHAAPEDAPEQMPDIQADPLKALEYLGGKVQAYETQERERAERKSQEAAQQKQIQQIQTYGAQAEEEFRQAQPDYDDAAQHYAKTRLEELSQVHGLSGADAQRVMAQELQSLIVQCSQSGRNPAEAIYSAAGLRGYAKASPKPAEADAKLDKIKQGQQEAKSLPRGGKVNTDPTVRQLIEDDEDPLIALHRGEESEFDKKFDKVARQMRRR